MRNRTRRGFGVILACLFFLSAIPFQAAADELTVSAYRQVSYPGQREGHWAVRVGFNNPVFPSNLGSLLTVKVDAASAGVDIVIPDSGERATEAARQFLLVSQKRYDKPATVTIEIQKDLSDASGRILLKKPFTYQFTTLEKVIVSHVGSFAKSKKDKGITVQSSRWVPTEDFTRAVKIVPAVPNFSISREGPRSFQLMGDFEAERDYVLHVAPISADSGQAIFQAREIKFKGPGIKRGITFHSQRSVIELKSRQLLAVKLAGVPKIRCVVERVPPYMVPEVQQALSKHKVVKELKLEEKAEKLKKSASAAKLSPLFFTSVSSDTDAFVSTEAQDAIKDYSLPLSFRKNPDRGGAWIVAVSDADKVVEHEALKLVQITDLAISYKLSGNSLLVWVTSLHTGQPVGDVDLLLTQKDGHHLFLGKTAQDGVLLAKHGQKFPAVTTGKEDAGATNVPIDFGHVEWLIAATTTDSCAIKVKTDQLRPASVVQVKKLKEKPDASTGQAFTERGVYRPGETVHFKFVSRAYKDTHIVSPTGKKVTVEITDPRGDVVYSKEHTLGEFGSCYDVFETKKFSPVGTYTLTVSSPTEGKKEETQQFTTTFMVQEFKKIRHFATLSLKKEERPDHRYVGLKREEELLSVEVKGQYYTGGPVKNGQVRWKTTLVPVVNTVSGLEGYFFGNEDETTQFLESGEATLDKDGKLDLTVPLDPRLLTGIYGVKVSATVLDIDGEPATEVETYNPKLPFLVGIGSHPKQVQSGYSAPLPVVVVDKEGKKVTSGKVKVTIMRQDYFYVEKRDEQGNISPQYEQGWAKSASTEYPIVNGQANVQMELFDSGAYLVEISYESEETRYAGRTLFNVGWQEDMAERERRRQDKGMLTANEILVSMSKKEYRAGESAVIQFSSPRPVKKALITLERGEILDYQVIDVKGGAGAYEFTIKEQYHPNVYVSVIAAAGRDGYPVYASQSDTDIPTLYFGYGDVSVKSVIQKLKVDIEPGVTELKGRPAETKKLSFRVTDAEGKGVVSEMAVCVVDEAVLALTRFQTPDLSALTKFNLPLAVFSGDLRLDLISQDLFRVFSTRPLTGGGVGLGEVSPTLRKDFRPVAYFNPAVITDASGRATVEFKLPDTTTAYRVYAVVCDKGPGFVSGQRNMVVTKEFFIEPSLTRFLIPGDTVTFPVALHNKTKEKGDVSLQIKGSPDLNVRLAQSRLQMEPMSSSVVHGAAQVKGGAAQGVITTEGKFSGDPNTYSDAIQQTVPIHSRFLPVRYMKLGSFKEKTDLVAKLPQALKGLSPDSLTSEDFQVRLSLSFTNWSKLGPGLKYLLAFPYGCIEQTSSGIIPLAGLHGLVKSETIPGVTVEAVDKFLKGGVERLLSMQLPSGGFSYWPGQNEISDWGTLYATFALVNARNAGLDVPEERLNKAFQFIREQIFSKENSEENNRMQAWTLQMGLWCLAEGQSITPQEFEEFFKRFHAVNNQDKAFLLLTAKKIGYSTPENLTKLLRSLDPKPDPARAQYYDSTYREIAACLMAAVELGTAPKKADEWAGMLLQGLKPDGRWFSTADTGWCLLALSEYYRSQPADKTKVDQVTFRISYGDRKADLRVPETGADLELDAQKVLEHPNIRIEADTKRLANYTLYITYPDVVKDPAELSRGFSLTKRIENLSGQDEIRVGDVVRVILNISIEDSLRKPKSKLFEYLALEDPVPAGIVPINPEFKTEGVEKEPEQQESFDYDGTQFRPDYSEFRDDGVRLFKDRAWSRTFKYSYLARAVAEGDFWMRGSRISLMYDPEYFGKTLGQRVKILPAVK
jgi:uncharacterized protein YfaS (alpha-2-macroglobulin family)